MIDHRANKFDYVYPFLLNQTKEATDKNYLSTEPIGISIYEDCYALPERSVPSCLHCGGLDYQGEIVKNTAWNRWNPPTYIFKPENAVVNHETVIFIGYLNNHCWGHTITDSLATIWWFHTDEYRDNYSTLPIYYWGPSPLHGNYYELFKLAGLPMERLHFLDTITFFDKVIVPDLCFDSCNSFYTKEYPKLIDSIINRCNIKDTFPHKVLLCRNMPSKQYISKYILKTLHSQGFITIFPELYSVEDQICIYQNADIIVSDESSTCHNFVFAKKNSPVVILRKANYNNIFQIMINQLKCLDVTYIDSHLSVLALHDQLYEGPFFLWANDNFCNCFHIDKMLFPFNEFHRYLSYNLYFQEGEEDILANRMQWDINYAKLLALEISKARDQNEKRLEWILHIPFFKKSFKEKVFRKILKTKMRCLL